MALTKTECDKLEIKTKAYKKFDGGGLYLEVKPNGSKLWRLKYRFVGKEKRLSFGAYPTITLNQAREKRREAKLLLSEGLDPAEIKKEKIRQTVLDKKNDFYTVALEWFNLKKEEWSERNQEIVLNRLHNDIFPYLKNRPVKKIKPPEILNLLRIIEKRGAFYQVKRVRQICTQVFNYAIQVGFCDDNPCVNLRGALRTAQVKHYPSLSADQIPELLEAIEKNDARLYARTRRAIKLSMLTFVRPGELRRARWNDINLDRREWLIPAQFMKMGKEHFVPLARQAVEILQEQYIETGHMNCEWVFPGQINPKKPMSDGTVNVALKKLGYHGRMTAHGFRALARTTIREKLKYYPDIIEAQLAHKPPGPLGAAYDRAQFQDERKKMMQDWADYIDRIFG